MIVASIFTGAAPLTFTGWRRSHPTVQDWVCLLAAAWSRKGVISAASELQDCIVFPERKAKCCVCRWQTNQNVVSHTRSERTLGTMLFTIFDSQFKLGLKDPFQSEQGETDLWLMSLSVSRWSSATKWPTSTGCMKTLARSEPQCAVLPRSCASCLSKHPWCRETEGGAWRPLRLILLYWEMWRALAVFAPRPYKGWKHSRPDKGLKNIFSSVQQHVKDSKLTTAH